MRSISDSWTLESPRGRAGHPVVEDDQIPDSIEVFMESIFERGDDAFHCDVRSEGLAKTGGSSEPTQYFRTSSGYLGTRWPSFSTMMTSTSL